MQPMGKRIGASTTTVCFIFRRMAAKSSPLLRIRSFRSAKLVHETCIRSVGRCWWALRYWWHSAFHSPSVSQTTRLCQIDELWSLAKTRLLLLNMVALISNKIRISPIKIWQIMETWWFPQEDCQFRPKEWPVRITWEWRVQTRHLDRVWWL